MEAIHLVDFSGPQNGSASRESSPNMKEPDVKPAQSIHTGLGVDSLQYTPLKDPENQIRLLYLYPAKTSERIICEMTTHFRSAAPKYHTISYTWGDKWLVSDISVNGQIFEGQILEVKQNCLNALLQARLHLDDGHFIWIDAICIDQSNVDEKSHQVTVMGGIFEQAESVFACVGPMTDSAAYFFDTAEKIAGVECGDSEECSFCDENCGLNDTYVTEDEFHRAHNWLESIQTVQFANLKDAFCLFGNRIYWKRLWIVQELSLARKIFVLCGRRKIAWWILGSLTAFLEEITWEKSEALASIASQSGIDKNSRETLRESIMYNNAMVGISKIISRGRLLDFGAHMDELFALEWDDARDRIYGLLRIIDWHSSGPPLPDYRLSATDLAIDTLSRLGRSFSWNLYTVQDLLELVGVDWEESASHLLKRRPERMAQSAQSLLSFGEQDCSVCTCDHSITPKTAMELHTHRFATIYEASDNALYITFGTQEHSCQHIQVELLPEDEYGFIVGKAQCPDSLGITFTSGVRAGDLLVNLEKWPTETKTSQEPIQTWFCVVLRETSSGIFAIVCHAEVYRRGKECSNDAGCSCLNHYARDNADYKEKFVLLVDAEDAVANIISGEEDRGDERLRNDGLLDPGPRRSTNKRFGRMRFSSFAFERITWSKSTAIDGCRSPDGQSIVCAQCGGLFVRKEIIPPSDQLQTLSQ